MTSKGLTIQLISDIHLEHMRGKMPSIPRRAPVIGLLGDIGLAGSSIYAAFVRDLSQQFEQVLIIAGNHEYYGGEHFERKLQIQLLASSLQNVHFLDRRSVKIGGVTIAGCTLWSHIPQFVAPEVLAVINDYRVIKIQGSTDEDPMPLSIGDTNGLHLQDVAFLRKEIELAKRTGQSVLILTHHAPLTKGTSSPLYEERATNHAFSTDLSSLMGEPVVAWAYGHTHYNPKGLQVKGTIVVANQKGYSCERTGAAFDPGFTLQIADGMCEQQRSQ